MPIAENFELKLVKKILEYWELLCSKVFALCILSRKLQASQIFG